VLATLVGCSHLPANQERARTESIIGGIDQVKMVNVGCGSRLLAGDALCAEVIMRDDAKIRFSRLGFRAFGAAAVNVFVEEAGGLEPRIASCGGVGSPNFHGDGALAHRFRPALIDVKEAIERYREILRDVQYWPQCPQHWEVQDKFGANHRYCMRRSGATEEPPRPPGC
jgi:hypothetical protein